MAEYIDRDAAIAACFDGFADCRDDCAANIRSIPAADVVERKTLPEDVEELVKRLRNAAHWADKGLVIDPSIHYEAADAIEDLTNKIMQAENDSGLYDELPMMVLSEVKEPPKEETCIIPASEEAE